MTSRFAVPESFEVPDLTVAGPVRAVDDPQRVRRSTGYYDTHDLRLAREGITVRRREGGDDEGWHLTLPALAAGREAGVGVEVHLPLAAGATEAVPPEPVPVESVPAELADLVTAFTRRAPLEAVATVRTDRQVRVLRRSDGSPVGELVLDEVSVLDATGHEGGAAREGAPDGRARVLGRFRELELVERSAQNGGDQSSDLRKVVRRLLAAGATTGPMVPELERALGSAAGAAPTLPVRGKLSSSAAASELVAAHITRQVRALRQADVGVRRGEDDAVHQMRVAARRLRSGLRVFRPLLDRAWADDLRAELGWLAGELGRSRDSEVLAARLQAGIQRLPAEVDAAAAADFLREHLARDADAGRRDALAALRSARYSVLMEELVEAANAPVTTPAARSSAASVLPVLVGKAWRRFERQSQALQLSGHDDDWHEVRKSAKAVRYAAEAVTPVVGRPAKELARQVETVTEALGEHQDAAVAATALTQMITGPDAEVAFALGVLYGQQRMIVHRAREDFLAAWPDVSHARHRAWLRTKG